MSSIFRQFLDKGCLDMKHNERSLNFESSKFEFFFPGCVLLSVCIRVETFAVEFLSMLFPVRGYYLAITQ